MKILISEIKKKSSERPTGYFEDVISRGKIIGDYLELSPENYRLLLIKYRQTSNQPRPCCGR